MLVARIAGMRQLFAAGRAGLSYLAKKQRAVFDVAQAIHLPAQAAQKRGVGLLRLIGVVNPAQRNFLVDADLEFVLSDNASHDGAQGGFVPASSCSMLAALARSVIVSGASLYSTAWVG